MVRLGEATAVVRMVRLAHSDTGDARTRGREVLEELRGLVDYAGALLAVWDPARSQHVTVAAARYDDEMVRVLGSSAYVGDAKWPILQARRRPLRWQDVPGSADSSEFFRNELSPRGFHEGVTTPVFGGKGHYLGMLALNVESVRPPSDAVVEMLHQASPSLGRLLERAIVEGHSIAAPNRFELTARELQVLSALVAGKSNRQAARQWGISDRTVSTHVEHILQKLGVANRTAAVAKVLRSGDYLPEAPFKSST